MYGEKLKCEIPSARHFASLKWGISILNNVIPVWCQQFIDEIDDLLAPPRKNK
jgi:hypothetical protein